MNINQKWVLTLMFELFVLIISPKLFYTLLWCTHEPLVYRFAYICIYIYIQLQMNPVDRTANLPSFLCVNGNMLLSVSEKYLQVYCLALLLSTCLLPNTVSDMWQLETVHEDFQNCRINSVCKSSKKTWSRCLKSCSAKQTRTYQMECKFRVVVVTCIVCYL